MTFVERYLELGLQLGRHVDGLVDAYYGPPELAERANAGEPEDPARLAASAATLLAELKGEVFEAQRARWLRGQVEGLECVARRLAGEELPYAEEVERCYGVRPEWTDEDVFAAAHRELDEVLPGSGSLAERYEAWQDARLIPGDRIADAVARVTGDLRGRADALLGLPDGEAVELDLVHDEPWQAFNYVRAPLGTREPGAGREGDRVPHRPGVAGVRGLLQRRAPARARLRRRRPEQLVPADLVAGAPA